MYETSAQMSAQMHRLASAIKIHRSRCPKKNQSHSGQVKTVQFKPVMESSQQAGGSGQHTVEPVTAEYHSIGFRCFYSS